MAIWTLMLWVGCLTVTTFTESRDIMNRNGTKNPGKMDSNGSNSDKTFLKYTTGHNILNNSAVNISSIWMVSQTLHTRAPFSRLIQTIKDESAQSKQKYISPRTTSFTNGQLSDKINGKSTNRNPANSNNSARTEDKNNSNRKSHPPQNIPHTGTHMVHFSVPYSGSVSQEHHKSSLKLTPSNLVSYNLTTTNHNSESTMALSKLGTTQIRREDFSTSEWLQKITSSGKSQSASKATHKQPEKMITNRSVVSRAGLTSSTGKPLTTTMDNKIVSISDWTPQQAKKTQIISTSKVTSQLRTSEKAVSSSKEVPSHQRKSTRSDEIVSTSKLTLSQLQTTTTSNPVNSSTHVVSSLLWKTSIATTSNTVPSNPEMTHIVTTSKPLPSHQRKTSIVTTSNTVPSNPVKSHIVTTSNTVPSKPGKTHIVTTSKPLPSYQQKTSFVTTSKIIPSHPRETTIVFTSNAVPRTPQKTSISSASKMTPSQSQTTTIDTISKVTPSQSHKTTIFATSKIIPSTLQTRQTVSKSAVVPSQPKQTSNVVSVISTTGSASKSTMRPHPGTHAKVFINEIAIAKNPEDVQFIEIKIKRASNMAAGTYVVVIYSGTGNVLTTINIPRSSTKDTNILTYDNINVDIRQELRNKGSIAVAIYHIPLSSRDTITVKSKGLVDAIVLTANNGKPSTLVMENLMSSDSQPFHVSASILLRGGSISRCGESHLRDTQDFRELPKPKTTRGLENTECPSSWHGDADSKSKHDIMVTVAVVMSCLAVFLVLLGTLIILLRQKQRKIRQLQSTFLGRNQEEDEIVLKLDTVEGMDDQHEPTFNSSISLQMSD